MAPPKARKLLVMGFRAVGESILILFLLLEFVVVVPLLVFSLLLLLVFSLLLLLPDVVIGIIGKSWTCAGP